jgi:hypothetical protein
MIQAELGQRPGQRADHGRTVHAPHTEPRQVPARHHHPGQSLAAARAAVITRHDHLMAPVSPLRRRHPDLRARPEMPHPRPHLQAARTRGGLLRDVRHDAEGSQLPRVITHRPIIGVRHSPGNRETATAGQTLRPRDLIEATFARTGLTLTVSYSTTTPPYTPRLRSKAPGLHWPQASTPRSAAATGAVRLALEPPIPYGKRLIWRTADPLPAPVRALLSIWRELCAAPGTPIGTHAASVVPAARL